jgi:hypothetical protein
MEQGDGEGAEAAQTIKGVKSHLSLHKNHFA